MDTQMYKFLLLIEITFLNNFKPSLLFAAEGFAVMLEMNST
jgi:hypothetical protein